jgi:hypothetical protein
MVGSGRRPLKSPPAISGERDILVLQRHRANAFPLAAKYAWLACARCRSRGSESGLSPSTSGRAARASERQR